MDDPNITMEEYIMHEEEKAQNHGKVFNWETAKYGKIWYDEDIHDLRSVETEFPAIDFNDQISSEKTLYCESTVSSLNDEIDFKISFDDSNDEDYTPTVSYFDDLDFFKYFENEFPAIVYNDAKMSKSDLLTEPILSPQHINEFDLNDETSLSEYDEEEQNLFSDNNCLLWVLVTDDDPFFRIHTINVAFHNFWKGFFKLLLSFFLSCWVVCEEYGAQFVASYEFFIAPWIVDTMIPIFCIIVLPSSRLIGELDLMITKFRTSVLIKGPSPIVISKGTSPRGQECSSEKPTSRILESTISDLMEGFNFRKQCS
ncbi:hypothetical protein Tco_1058227 [Tanacetum coccineum]|uniref:Uncharacterized protein n=1 Tax=Tanacetum coccineum TaxID=301880 RepID=A0ABQ5H7L1_9ASTR